MSEPKRVSPQEIRDKVLAGEALLVCAYDSDDRFLKHQLEGAISLSAFQSRLPTLPKAQEVAFYCGCPHDATAVGRAAEYLAHGYPNAEVLHGGVAAWKKAGFAVEST